MHSEYFSPHLKIWKLASLLGHICSTVCSYNLDIGSLGLASMVVDTSYDCRALSTTYCNREKENYTSQSDMPQVDCTRTCPEDG